MFKIFQHIHLNRCVKEASGITPILNKIYVVYFLRKRKQVTMNPSLFMSEDRVLKERLLAANLMLLQNKKCDVRESVCQIFKQYRYL